jgi:hypothetical protein
MAERVDSVAEREQMDNLAAAAVAEEATAAMAAREATVVMAAEEAREAATWKGVTQSVMDLEALVVSPEVTVVTAFLVGPAAVVAGPEWVAPFSTARP